MAETLHPGETMRCPLAARETGEDVSAATPHRADPEQEAAGLPQGPARLQKIDPNEVLFCGECSKQIFRGSGKVPKQFCDPCLEIRKALNGLERALRQAGWPNTPEGWDRASMVAGRLFELRNLLPQKLERDAAGRFTSKEGAV